MWQKSLPPVPRPLPVCNRDISVIPEPIPSVQSPDDHWSLTSEDEAQFLLSEPAQNCYFPEGIYISIALPTCKPKELTTIKTHCCLTYQHSNQSILEIYLPISKLCEITPDPLVFQNLLWKSKTKFTHTFPTPYPRRKGLNPHILQKPLCLPHRQSLLRHLEQPPLEKWNYLWSMDPPL